MDTFRFRLNCIDHYQAVPTELDPLLRRAPGLSQRHNAPSVPVIRVFGATETGQKVCAHIHGALPYLYLKYHGSLEQDAVRAYIRSLRVSIDNALAATYRRNAYDGKTVYVGHITLVKGVPYYGYHVGYTFFLKVYLLNPANMTRFTDLLHQGAILNRVFQPYESHLQFLLQWMCDYNLYGCDYIDCADVKFRGPVPDSDNIDIANHKWHTASIPVCKMADQDRFPRQSHCAIEVDVCVHDILNRHELQARSIHHTPFEKSSVIKSNQKYVPSMAGLWRDEAIRRKRRLGLSDPSSSPFPPEVLVSMSADTRSTTKGGWIHEQEYRERLEQLVEDEHEQAPIMDQATPMASDEDGASIQTALESVEDLYPGRIDTQLLLEDEDRIPSPNQHDISPHKHDGVVNESPYGVEPQDDMETEHPNQAEIPSLDPLSLIEAQMARQIEEESELESTALIAGSNASKEGDAHHTTPISDSQSYRSPVKDFEAPKETHPSPNHPSHAPILDLGGKGSEYRPDQEVQSKPRQSSIGGLVSLDQGESRTLPVPMSKGMEGPSATLKVPERSDLQRNSRPTATPSRIRKSHLLSPALGTASMQQHIAPNHRGANDVSRQGMGPSVKSQLVKTATGYFRTVHYKPRPPSLRLIQDALYNGSLPILYQDAYYSNESDVPERARDYAGKEYVLRSTTVPYLPVFSPLSAASDIHDVSVLTPKLDKDNSEDQSECRIQNWEFCSAPPSYKLVKNWLRRQPHIIAEREKKEAKSSQQRKKTSKHISQVEGPTQRNKHGFKYSQKKTTTSVEHETQYMSIMSLEVHVNNRGTLAPDPAEDEVQSIFWCFQGDEGSNDGHSNTGIICLSDENGIINQMRKQTAIAVEAEEDELDLINKIVDIVRCFDPDILTGYEVHNTSWGYLIERARLRFEYDLCDEISRTKSQSHRRFGKEADRWGFTHTSTIRVTGRHMINIWRAMRGELNLLQYTMENVVYHLLHRRIPHYSFADLTTWYESREPRHLAKVLDYFITRVQLNLDILETNDIVPRTSEQARLLGVDFFSVISRGSQYKVESTMFRIAKPENYILPSPSRKQVGQQNALECLPLVMEPQSAFYSSPLLVLDFQSLYPSVMIAYNYCYSTCLGRVVPWRGRNKLGFMDFERRPGLLDRAKDHINIAPNGMMYVKPEMRKSLLAKMLGEILETRVMVKSGMKQDKDDKTLQKLLNNRQLALKLLANVTYGYTSASFSGRMPCSEIADSIVQTGRETLEKAIAYIHSVKKWDAEVVYGDTDSLFVYLKGRTREQAFSIGEEIAEAITRANPRPIKLKFEKLYHPCVLLAKKRYVGFKYESRDQKEPEFDAKGIETVRRDGTPAEQKIEERAIKILFRTSDLSQVKDYFLGQCSKIMEGRISIQDFLFAKEVKLGTYSDQGPPPPGALIATKRMLADPRAEPQYGERVPYVVISGAPNARLIDRCVSPDTMLLNHHIELDAEYYITKNLIPPLERIFNLVGANVRQWYEEMPKVQRVGNIVLPIHPQQPVGDDMNREGTNPMKTLGTYMESSVCLVCRSKLPLVALSVHGLDTYVRVPVCKSCLRRPARALFGLKNIILKNEKRVRNINMICRSCSNLAWGEEVRCDNHDCPVFYTRKRQTSKVDELKAGLQAILQILQGGEPGFDNGHDRGHNVAAGDVVIEESGGYGTEEDDEALEDEVNEYGDLQKYEDDDGYEVEEGYEYEERYEDEEGEEDREEEDEDGSESDDDDMDEECQ